MKVRFWLSLSVLVGLSAGLGYYLGKSTPSHDPVAEGAHTEPNSASEKKILYYRNPMGLADISPTPKKDSMGMDYLPVYEESTQETKPTNAISIDTRTVQKMGVQTHRVESRAFAHTVHALGTLVIAEPYLYDVTPPFKAWAFKLHANTLGQRINRGDILFDAKIPNLYAAEVAYRQAIQKIVESTTASAAIKKSAELALVKAVAALDDIGVGLEEMQRLQQGGEPYNQMPYRAPVSGVVLDKRIVEGGYFEAGTTVFQIADISKLWLEIQLPEHELAHVAVGDRLNIEMLAHPGKKIESTVDYIYPTLNPDNRGIKLRAVLDNNDYQYKPGQTAHVILQSKSRNTLAIPRDALIDSGQKQRVLLALPGNAFAPKEIQTGERNNDWVEITAGLEKGDTVVTSANFLIDAESRLQAALAGFVAPQEASPKPTTAP